MALKELQGLWWERVFERDRQVFTDKDTLDVKTGLILVILIFLAGQSAEFFKSSATSLERYVQALSITFLIISGIFAVAELWPRTFFEEAEPQEYEDRLSLLRNYYEDEPNPEEFALTRAFEERLEAAHRRIGKNIAINEEKSSLLNRSFYCAVIALAANLATLAIRLF